MRKIISKGVTAAAVMLLAGGVLAGCSSAPETYPLISQPLSHPPVLPLTAITHQAADAMVASLFGKLRHRETILPASFVDERDMNKTSPLGRLIARQMASRFTQAGHSVVEIKLRNTVKLRQGEGQLMLSRELEALGNTHKVYAVLAGSYAIAKSRLFVTAQMIRIKDGVAMASNDFSLPLDHDIRTLLGQQL